MLIESILIYYYCYNSGGIDRNLRAGLDAPTFDTGIGNAFLDRQGFEDGASTESIDSRGDFSTCSLILKEHLKTSWKMSDIKYIVRQLRIDLQQEPEYSRIILDHFIWHSKRSDIMLAEVGHFLDDPILNPQSANNFSKAMGYLIFSRATSAGLFDVVFNAICRALELGLIPREEILRVITRVPEAYKLLKRKYGDKKFLADMLMSFYERMWDAIGRCTVFSYKDLDSDLVNTWLEILAVEIPPCLERRVRLARKIIISTRCLGTDLIPSTPIFIAQWLNLRSNGLERNVLGDGTGFIDGLLDRLDPDAASRCIIRVTEILASSTEYLQNRKRLLSIWQSYLRTLQDTQSMALSYVWTEEWESLISGIVRGPAEARLSTPLQAVLRLWIIVEFRHAESPYIRWDRDGKKQITSYCLYNLTHIYGTIVDRGADTFLANVLLDMIRQVDLPSNGTLPTVVGITGESPEEHSIKSERPRNLDAIMKVKRRPVTDLTFATLSLIESGRVTPDTILGNELLSNVTRWHMYMILERAIRTVDITHPSYMKYQLELGRNGNALDASTFLRLIRHHKALKIALARAWGPLPLASDMALIRYHPPWLSALPNPHAAVDFIHSMAVAFAGNANLENGTAFHLVQLLYKYLLQHNAPIKPTIVRALYYAGFARSRATGRKYKYILDVLRKHETPEVVKKLMDPYNSQRGGSFDR